MTVPIVAEGVPMCKVAPRRNNPTYTYMWDYSLQGQDPLDERRCVPRPSQELGRGTWESGVPAVEHPLTGHDRSIGTECDELIESLIAAAGEYDQPIALHGDFDPDYGDLSPDFTQTSQNDNCTHNMLCMYHLCLLMAPGAVAGIPRITETRYPKPSGGRPRWSRFS